MGKELEEKYERICDLKEKAICLLEMGMNQDVSQIDAKEIGELMDIIKDAEEAIKYAEEANYFHKVTESMDSSNSDEKSYYLNKYIPEYGGKFYTPIHRGNIYYDKMMQDDDSYRRLHYDSSNIHPEMEGRDYREGKSPMIRKTYMEMRENGTDKSTKSKELEHYLNELGEDMAEMINGMDANDKAVVKQKLTTLANKIA